MAEGKIVAKKVDRATGEAELEVDDALYKKMKKRANAEGMSVDEYADKIVRRELKRVKKGAVKSKKTREKKECLLPIPKGDPI